MLDKFGQDIPYLLCKIKLTLLHLVSIQKGWYQMKSISKEYLLLFNAVTDAEESLRQLREKLVAVQQQAEELFLEETDSAERQKSE